MRGLSADTLAAVLEEVAAEEITPRFQNLAAGEVTDKGGGDFVTRADHEAERRLTAVLPSLLPGSVVVGEEAAHDDPSVIRRIAGDVPVWIIDPLDGTNNFARGNPMFAVMAALVVKGEPILGAIHMPLRQATAKAERGGGAYIAGRKLAAAKPKALAAMNASIHTGYLPPNVQDPMRRAALAFASNEEIYCAGHVYAALAEGRLDAALFWRTKPWDHAMGTLILAEAGGHSAFADGLLYTPRIEGRFGLIAASSLDTWTRTRDHLFPGGR